MQYFFAIAAEESPDELNLRNNRRDKMGSASSVYLIVAAVMAALGGMLFGYDTGKISLVFGPSGI